MSDGLRDEAVEAVARAMHACGFGYDIDADGVARASMLSVATHVLSALPAGLYRSDGKGKVTPIDLEDAVRVMADALLADLGLPRYGGHRATIERRERLVLAALSATDAEERA
ncbi:MAG TPA: hypothetical protein VN213_18295 [Solirubrobacteraceae bacterium]|nr:hypothetical protein [Solirubrobacteraceae bacterium]